MKTVVVLIATFIATGIWLIDGIEDTATEVVNVSSVI